MTCTCLYLLVLEGIVQSHITLIPMLQVDLHPWVCIESRTVRSYHPRGTLEIEATHDDVVRTPPAFFVLV